MSKTMEKGLQLLDLFTEDHPYWRLDEISAYTEIPKPTALRLLRTLVEVGFLQRTPVERNGAIIDGDSYSLGLKLLQLGERVASGLEIRNIALPFMRQLQMQFNEAVQLITRENNNGVYIEKVESTRPVRLYTRVGRHAPLYAGACTRTLLSFLPDEEIDAILSMPLTNYASQTPKSAEEVWSLIKQVRSEGYAYSLSELEEGTVSIAVPIFNRHGEVEYSISIAGFPVSLPKENANHFLQSLWEAAANISEKIGYTHLYPYRNALKKS
ncbi:IclR family transcriptional regulator [Sporosarcina sp. resist]|uniref:IclR family transcriptional regulator n=1 Tax=Sporosarcina sp. resist TaxID=2762563 RepID=UPI00164DDF1C|nr:IclR family transcriptional regulator [Sporosarcina sp. resist]QNK87347.1 IclR family transcriptional regulator [Sporosarcina sp. resist]